LHKLINASFFLKAMKVDIIQHKNNKLMFINDDLWMWDTPRERKLQKQLSDKAFGNVLVAGYGLGIVQSFLLKNSRVKSVKTVEKYKDVIEKMKESGKIQGNVTICDFYKFSNGVKYDCIIGDIWEDIDPLFLKDYVKFKKKANTLLKPNGLILAWGKEFYEYLLNKK